MTSLGGVECVEEHGEKGWVEKVREKVRGVSVGNQEYGLLVLVVYLKDHRKRDTTNSKQTQI